MMTAMKKLCAVALAALLLVTGCANNKSWVYRGGDVEPPAGVYIYYLINSMSSAMTELLNAGQTDAAAMDPKDVLALSLEDQPVSQWVAADAQNSLREHIAVELQFAAKGLALEESDLTSMQASLESDWANYGTMYEPNGIAKSSIELVMMNALKRNALFESYYSEGGEAPVADDELRDLLVADYAKVGYLPIPKATAEPTGDAAADAAATAAIDAQNATLKAEAEAYVARMTAGEAVEDLVYEYQQLQAGEDAASVVKPEPGSQTLILSEEMAGVYYSSELVTGALATSVGTASFVEDPSFYYALLREDILADPADFTLLRPALLSDLKSGDFEAVVAAWAGELTFETNQPALNEYTPESLQLDI